VGEAGNRLARFTQLHPICCFCGGENSTETIDHVPPKAIFIDKKIPNKTSIEFPACKQCNEGSRQFDQVVAMIALTDPNSTGERKDKYFEKIFRGVANNANSVIHEIVRGFSGKRLASKELSEKVGTQIHLTQVGDKTRLALYTLTAKLGLAYFYRVTGKIISINGNVVVNIRSNADFYLEGIPLEYDWDDVQFIDETSDLSENSQFLWRYKILDDQSGGMFQFVIHKNIICVAIVVNEASMFSVIDHDDRTFAPGFLRRLQQPGNQFWTSTSLELRWHNYGDVVDGARERH
jgi:hypothetical protein